VIFLFLFPGQKRAADHHTDTDRSFHHRHHRPLPPTGVKTVGQRRPPQKQATASACFLQTSPNTAALTDLDLSAVFLQLLHSAVAAQPPDLPPVEGGKNGRHEEERRQKRIDLKKGKENRSETDLNKD
jgi:hypothetical protein